jgi:hypothetical protein
MIYMPAMEHCSPETIVGQGKALMQPAQQQQQ